MKNSKFLKPGERLDDLETHGLYLIQKKDGYCFNSDSVLLANFTVAKAKDKVCDLCSGNGVIALLVSAKNNVSVDAVEIQEEMCDRMTRTIKLNGLQDKIRVFCKPLQSLNGVLVQGSYDVVTVNPPYSKKGDGKPPENNEIAIARHELKVTLAEIIQTSSKLLRDGGKLFMVHQTERLSETILLLNEYGLKCKVLRFVYPKLKKNASVFLLQATKGAKLGEKVIEPLIVFNEDNTETEEVKHIYNR